MPIFSISTEGLKSLRSRELTQLEDLSTYNVLIGPNNAGKSTLLESIQLPRAASRPIPDDGLYSRDPPAERIAFEIGLTLSRDEVKSLDGRLLAIEVPDELLDALSRWFLLFEMRSESPGWPSGQAALRRWRLVIDSEPYEIGTVIYRDKWSSSYYDNLGELVQRVTREPPVAVRDLASTLRKPAQATSGPPLSPADNPLGILGKKIRQLADRTRRLDSGRVPRESWRMESIGGEKKLKPDAENLLAFLHVHFSRASQSECYEFNRAFHEIIPELHGFLDPVVDRHNVKLKIAPKFDADAEESYDIRNVGGAARQILCILAFVWTAKEGDVLLIEDARTQSPSLRAAKAVTFSSSPSQGAKPSSSLVHPFHDLCATGA